MLSAVKVELSEEVCFLALGFSPVKNLMVMMRCNCFVYDIVWIVRILNWIS